MLCLRLAYIRECNLASAMLVDFRRMFSFESLVSVRVKLVIVFESNTFSDLLDILCSHPYNLVY